MFPSFERRLNKHFLVGSKRAPRVLLVLNCVYGMGKSLAATQLHYRRMWRDVETTAVGVSMICLGGKMQLS